MLDECPECIGHVKQVFLDVVQGDFILHGVNRLKGRQTTTQVSPVGRVYELEAVRWDVDVFLCTHRCQELHRIGFGNGFEMADTTP